MSTISIIGLGNMSRALATLALAGGNTVELIGRDPDKAAALASDLGDSVGAGNDDGIGGGNGGGLGGVTTGTFGAAPAGDIVILAVLYTSAATVVEQYGDALSGKILVDITNPFDPSGSGLLTPGDSSAAQEIATVAPADSHVMKAFNTIFAHVLAAVDGDSRPLDVFFAGDDVDAKARVAVFIDSLGLRPLDVGPLSMAGRLEQAGLLVMGLARYGVKNFNFSLGVDLRD